MAKVSGYVREIEWQTVPEMLGHYYSTFAGYAEKFTVTPEGKAALLDALFEVCMLCRHARSFAYALGHKDSGGFSFSVPQAALVTEKTHQRLDKLLSRFGLQLSITEFEWKK